MPQRKSAKKALKKSLKRRARNLSVRKKIKRAIKQFKDSLEKKDWEKAKANLDILYKTLDKAARKKVIHPNKSARKKSHFSLLLAKARKLPT